MNKILTIITLFFCGFIFSQNIDFEEKPFQEILQKAKKENKLIFMDAYASWCGPCKLMEKNVFTKLDVSQYYNATFVNSHFDMEKGEGRDIAAKYGVRSFPTYLFLNGDGEVVYRGMGYLPDAQFIALGKEANSIGKGGSAKEKFEKGDKDPAFLMNAIKMYANSDPNFAKKVAERYFEVRQNKDYSQEEVSALLFFLKTGNDPLYKTFVKDKNSIIKHLPEETYNEFNKQMQLNSIVEKAADLQNKSLNQNLFLQEATKLVGDVEAQKALARLKVNFYPAVGNFTDYEKAALDYFKDGEGFEDRELASAAYIFAEHVNNAQSLKQSLLWAEKAVMRSESAENTYVLAKLYLKTGNKEAAKMYAEQSVRLTKQKGADASIPEKLLSEIK